MSHARDEFGALQEMVDTVPALNPYLELVNGAQGSMDIDTIINPTSLYWLRVADTLSALGLTEEQVQVIWFKQAEAYPGLQGEDTSFVPYINGLAGKFGLAMNIIREMFPNANLSYVAGRSYGGYATVHLNPEPLAYYTGWSARLLIENQINGDPSLRFDGPDPQAPWISWGVYLWADGFAGRGDGLQWICPDDYQSDGTHLSETGALKAATSLLDFFRTDETARIWFLENQPPVVSDIPGQTITSGERFRPIRLDNYVSDPDDEDSLLTWSWEGNAHLSVVWNESKRGLRIRPEPGWTGSETIVLTATDRAGNSDTDDATLTVLSALSESTTFSPDLMTPATTALGENFPNPFNPATTISYGLNERSFVRISVYTLLGEEVSRLVDGQREAGYHRVVWDGRDAMGLTVGSGIYLYRMEAGEYVVTRKMLLIR